MKTRRAVSHTRHPNHERWLVSYADFVTLLFAFFVVMFATANADKSKAKAVAEAVKAALSGGNTQALQQAIKDMAQHENAHQANTIAELGRSQALLREALQEEMKKGQVELHMEPRGLVISLKQGALFDSGDATVKDSARPIMRKIANVALNLSNQLRLEGHTDNIPIHNDRYRNNWELSSARSIALLEMLTEDYGLAMNRLSVSGYADVAPIASNETEEGRTRNRRVDVVILSSAAPWSESGKYGARSRQ